jgi:FkbM family methyltransferase
MKKVLFLVPHLSTGGMPQYTYDLMRKIKDDVEVYCVEYSMISHHFVVQRNRIINLLGDRFFCLGDNKNELFQLIDKINPDIIHFQEMPEYFLDNEIATKLYSVNRKYLIVETSHDSSFSASNKRFFPDHFALISQYQKNEFSKLGIPIDFVEADIEYKERQDRTEGLKKLGLDPNLKHVVNVGLFTPRKNQAEAVEYARALEGQPVQFHFIGNQADNFADYWKPILQNLPLNVKIWGERSDVDDFYSCMDMMLFTSRGTGNDKETSPLVIRESIGHHLPALIFNLPVYLGMYDKYETITYMDFDNYQNNINLICKILELDYNKTNQVKKDDLVDVWFENHDNKIHIKYNGEDSIDCKISVKDLDSNMPIFWFQSILQKTGGCWVIPSPKHIYDFSADDTFRSFLLEFYTMNNEFLFSKELPIKDIPLRRTIRINSPDPFDCTFFNYNEMFILGHYEPYNIRDVKTVFDIGANSGLFSRYLLEKGCTDLYLFEPNTRATRTIKSTLDGYSNYELIEKAIGVNDEDLTFYITDSNTTVGSISKEHVANNGTPIETKIPAVSLKSFINKRGIKKIGLIKMDIERAEYDIIENLEDEIFEMTESFLIEFHYNDGNNVTKLIDRIKSHGFRLDQIRDQSQSSNPDITDSYRTSLNGTIYLTKIPKRNSQKIKGVQFLLNGDYQKQEESVKNLSLLEKYGIYVEKHYNDVYVDLPPASKSARPHDVSLELKPNALTPAHYGCYDSFKTAVLSEFDSDIDFLLVFEGDAKIQDHDLFIEKLNEAMTLTTKYNLDYVSFGGIYDLAYGVLQSRVMEEMTEDFFVCDKIIGCQCLLFPQKSRKKIKEILRREPWDALDIYLNKVSPKNGLRVGVSKKTLVTQYDGISTIDNVVKQFKEFSI